MNGDTGYIDDASASTASEGSTGPHLSRAVDGGAADVSTAELLTTFGPADDPASPLTPGTSRASLAPPSEPTAQPHPPLGSAEERVYYIAGAVATKQELETIASLALLRRLGGKAHCGAVDSEQRRTIAMHSALALCDQNMVRLEYRNSYTLAILDEWDEDDS